MIYFSRVNGSLVRYEGMSQETIIAMLNDRGLTAEFIDEATYNEEVANREKLRLEAK
jgi:hypothetical protein